MFAVALKHPENPNEEDNLLCFFLCFSLPTRNDLALVKFYNAAATLNFLKTLENLPGNICNKEHCLVKFSFFKMDLAKEVCLSVFQTPFYG